MQGQKAPTASGCHGKGQAATADLDFSFMDIVDITDLQPQSQGTMPEPREVGLKKEKPKPNDVGKYDTRVVRMYNNKLEEFKDLFITLEKIVIDPLMITWLDLSLNSITLIDACICEFSNLQILYLHGNQIAKLTEVDKLAGMPLLKKLTLHGNPLAGDKFYKPYVLTRIRQLTNFDMAHITKADRATSNTLSKLKPTKRAKKPKDE